MFLQYFDLLIVHLNTYKPTAAYNIIGTNNIFIFIFIKILTEHNFECINTKFKLKKTCILKLPKFMSTESICTVK